MRNILVLPGNSARHAEWVKQFTTFNNLEFTFFPATYAHWENGGEFIDLDAEMERLAPILKNHNISGVIGKSIGSVLALRLMAEELINPEFCIFAGYPNNALRDTNLPVSEWLQKCTVPVQLLQNSNDPLGTFIEVKKVMEPYQNFRCIELEGDTHDYKTDDIVRLMPAN